MKEKGKFEASEMRSLFVKSEIIRWIIRSFLSVGLLGGGITLLALRIPGWSIIFGLPMVVISGVFIVYTYDDILNKYINIEDSKKDNLTDKDGGKHTIKS